MKFCLAFLIAFLFVYSAWAQQPPKSITYESEKYSYKIEYDSHFAKFESPEKTDDLVLKNPSTGFSFIVGVLTNDKLSAQTPQQFTDFIAANPEGLFKTLSGTSLDNLKIVKYGKTTVNRNPAFYFQTTGNPKTAEKDFPVEMYHVITLKGKYLFNLICGSVGENFVNDYAECQQLISSFAFKFAPSVRLKAKQKKIKNI